jgi:hypothetical protein
LVDLKTMGKFTYPTGTTGGQIAIRELRDKILWMRRARGSNVYAVVTLADKFMKTRFGGRQRPHFNIVRWVSLGGEGGEVAALPAPTISAATLAPVQEPTLAEDTNHSIDDLPGLGTVESTSSPKKPVKAAHSRKRVNTLEAG